MEALKANKRTELGTQKTRALRKQGLTPCIIYGHGKDNLAIAINQHDLDVVLKHGERLLEIDLGDAKENVLVKDVQYDTFGQVILHADLTRVDLTERVELTVSVVLRGTPAGLTEGGVLQQRAADVIVQCVVTAIPEDIRVQVNDLNIGDAVHAKDLELPEGAVLITDPEQVICSVTVVAEEEPEPEAEEGDSAEPEVIGEKKDDEGEAEAGEGESS